MTFGKIGCTKLLTNMLPYDMEVEYLSNDGSRQYIDTGIYWQINDTIEIQVAQNTIADQAAFGIATKIYGFSNNAGSSNLRTFYFGNAPYYGGASNNLPNNFGMAIHTIKINKDYANVDDIIIPYAGNTVNASQSLHTVILFGRAANTVELSFTKTWNGKIYYCKYWKNNILIYDVIPVRFTNKLGQTEGAMYDRISKQLFRNQGAGAFIIGPDKTQGETI